MRTKYIQFFVTLMLLVTNLYYAYAMHQYHDLVKRQAQTLNAALLSLQHCSGAAVATGL